MALQLITHSTDGTKQTTSLDSGVHSVKASSNTLYELRDTNTKKAPQKASVNKRGNDLVVDTVIDGQNASVVIENYYAASNSKLVGDLGNGEFYPLLTEGATNIPTSELPHMAAANSAPAGAYGSDFVNVGAVASTGTSWAAYALGGLAVAGGVAAAAGGGGGGGSSAAATPTTPTSGTPTATIALSDTTVNTGEKPEVRIVFSEAVSGFVASDLVVPNGSVSGFSTVDNITWTGVYTPLTNTKDDTNIISLNAGSYTNAAGVAGATATSANFTVDTTVAPPPALTVTLDDDESGFANIPGGSVLYTFTFSEAVVGFSASDVVVANGTKGTFSQTNPTTYTMEITPAQGFNGNMTVEVPAGAAISNASSVTNNASYVSYQRVDTVAPTVVSATLADTALVTGETTEFTVVFSEAVTGFNNSDLDMSAANGTISTLSSNDGGVTWKAIFTPNVNINDTTNIIQILNTYTDAAINSGSFGATQNYTIDTTTITPITDTIKPKLTITDDEDMVTANLDGSNTDGSTDANGADILYKFKFDEPVNDFTVDDVVIKMINTDGTTASTYTKASDTSGVIFRTWTKISDTEYTLAVHPEVSFEGFLDVSVAKDTYHDIAGNQGNDLSNVNSTQAVDMKFPFDVALTIDAAKNRLILTFDENLEQVNYSETDNFSVYINGNLTVVRAVSVADKSTGMQANQAYLYLDGVTDDLSKSRIELRYTEGPTDNTPHLQDLAGNDSPSFVVTIGNDTIAPNAPIVSLTTDSGTKSSDNITSNDAYTVTPSSNKDKIEYSTDNGTTWSNTRPSALQGANTISVREIDLAGNISNVSKLEFTYDSIAPNSPAVVLNSDTGSSNTDKITSTGTYTVTASEAGTTLEYSADNGTTWRTNKPTAAEGANSISVRETDTAGNVSNIAKLDFTLDNTLPILAIKDDEGAEVANMDGVNKDGTTDTNGSNILYTFEFSEAVNDFIASDIVITNGTLGTFTKISDTKYTLMVIPTLGFEGVMSVSVDRASYHDAAGNAGSDNSDTVSYQTVDMRAPFPVGTNDPTITSITADPANQRIIITFDENLEQVNQADPASFGVMINGTPVAVKAIGVSDNVAGMQDNQVFLYLDIPRNARGETFDWSTAGVTVSYTDTSGDLASIIQDLAGNDATSFNDSIGDSLAPNAKITMSDTDLGSGDVSIVTFKFSEAVNLKASDIDVTNANGALTNLTANADGTVWTADFKPTVGVSDTANTITLNGTYTDTHNNAGTAITSGNFIIDTLAPKLVSSTGNGSNDTITLTFDEALDAVNFADLGMFIVTDGTETPAVDDGAALVNYAVTAISISGNQATLSIDGAIDSTVGTTWKVTYSDPTGNTANALQDLYGSDVSSFTQNVVI